MICVLLHSYSLAVNFRIANAKTQVTFYYGASS